MFKVYMEYFISTFLVHLWQERILHLYRTVHSCLHDSVYRRKTILKVDLLS